MSGANFEVLSLSLFSVPTNMPAPTTTPAGKKEIFLNNNLSSDDVMMIVMMMMMMMMMMITNTSGETKISVRNAYSTS